MKRFLLFSCACLTIVFVSNHCNAQSRDKRTMELVMEVPKADPGKAFKALKKKLTALPQVSVEGFCDTKKLLMLKLNPKEYFNVLVAVDEAGFSYYIKKDLHIAEVISACGEGEFYTKECTSIE